MSRRRPTKSDQDSLDWYDRVSLIVWLPVSFVYLGVTLVQLFGRASYGPGLFWFDTGMSVLFLGDYLIRLYFAPDWRAFVRHVWNIADLIVIATPLAALRFGSELTSVVRIVRVIRLSAIAKRVWDSRTRTSHGGQVKWMAVVATGVVVLACLTVWSVESTHAGSMIHTPMDALWWAIVTMFTVGYGEMYPHSATGKVSAVVLMIAGIALFGWVTATLASWFVETGTEKDAKEQRDEMKREMRDMAHQLKHMEHHLQMPIDGEWEHQGSRTAPPRLPNEANAAEPASASGVTLDYSNDEVGIEWRETRSWRWVSRSSKTVYGRWVSASRGDAFWYCICVLLYAAALVQAYYAKDAFWPAAALAAFLFGFALLLRLPSHQLGWAQWGLLLSVAVLLSADVIGVWIMWALVLASFVLGALETRTSRSRA